MLNAIDFNSSTNTLSLGNGVYLDIELSDKFSELSCCTLGRVYVRLSDKKILIFEDYISEFLFAMRACLRTSLKILLSRTYRRVVHDIGYVWNRETHNYWSSNSKERYEEILDNNLCDHTGNSLRTWIYKNGKSYIFEVTPVYPWHSDDPSEGEEVESYEDFMKRYKPVLKTTLSVTCVNDLIRLSKRLLRYYYADCA